MNSGKVIVSSFTCPVYLFTCHKAWQSESVAQLHNLGSHGPGRQVSFYIKTIFLIKICSITSKIMSTNSVFLCVSSVFLCVTDFFYYTGLHKLVRALAVYD